MWQCRSIVARGSNTPSTVSARPNGARGLRRQHNSGRCPGQRADAWFAAEAATRRSARRLLVSDKPGHAGPVPASRRERAGRRYQGWPAGLQNPGFAYVGRSAAGAADTGSSDGTDALATVRFGLPTLPDRMERSSAARKLGRPGNRPLCGDGPA
jgi:hypothetical protein